MINFTFHHIGIAVFSIEKSSEFYENQGCEITETVFDPIQNVNICFINCKKNTLKVRFFLQIALYNKFRKKAITII